jgi:acetyl esterase/lipase
MRTTVKQHLTLLLGLTTFLPSLSVAAPIESRVQGLYESSEADPQAEARVVAQGDGDYHLLLRQNDVCSLIFGKTDGEVVRFAGVAGWSGEYTGNSISLKEGGGRLLKLHRVERHSPTLGKQAPPGSIVYLDGKSLANLKHTQGGKQPATDTSYEADGAYKIPEHGVDSDIYGPDFEYDAHLEFKLPLVPKAHGWARANAGWFFLPNNSKISVLDSFGEPGRFNLLPEKERAKILQRNPSAEPSFKGLVCGGVYGFRNPDPLLMIDGAKGNADDNLFPAAAAPPLEWQTLDVEYRVVSGGKPRLTAYLNGVKIHHDIELDLPARKGVFHFRPSAVLWRNFWAMPISAHAPKSETSFSARAVSEPKNMVTSANGKTDDSTAHIKAKLDTDIEIKRDIEIDKINGIPVLLDTAVRKSAAATAPLPAILMIHGGGWKNGNAHACLGQVMPNPGLYYAQNGYFVASVGYRLSGQAKWPAQIQDCKLAVRYLRAHATALNIDPDRIGCCGFSAGGHLAGCLGAMQDAPEMEGDGGYGDVSSRVQAVVMLSGPVDMTCYFDKKGGGSKAEEYKTDLFGEGWKQRPEILLQASSHHYAKAGLPPFWIGTSDKDAAAPVEQAIVLRDALGKNGVTFEFLLMKNGGHGLGPIKDHKAKGIGDPAPSPEEAKAMTLRFLDKHLKVELKQ